MLREWSDRDGAPLSLGEWVMIGLLGVGGLAGAAGALLSLIG